jgi:hypothetical protein
LFQINAVRREIMHGQAIHYQNRTAAMTESSGFSRRRKLTIAAGAAGTVAGVAAIVGASTPAHAAKAPQKAVKYQDTPKGEQRCENCELFEAPLLLQVRRRNNCPRRLVHRL